MELQDLQRLYMGMYTSVFFLLRDIGSYVVVVKIKKIIHIVLPGSLFIP
jgi:hypothetical protein